MNARASFISAIISVFALILIFTFFADCSKRSCKQAEEKTAVGETLLKAGNFEQAKQHFREAISLCPDSVKAYQGLGISLCRTGNIDEGLKALKTSLDLDPQNPETLMAKGICAENLAETGLETAISSYREALAINPENPVLHNQLGVAYQKTGDHEAAAEEFQKAIDIAPEMFVAYNNLGASLVMLGEYNDAVKLYQHAIKSHPDLTGLPFYTNLGIAFLYKNNLERAESAFLMETALNPEHIDAHVNLGNIYVVKGLYENAFKEYSRVLDIDPDHASALLNTAILYIIQEKPVEAITHLERLLSLNPSHAAAHYYLGKCLSLLGDSDKAIVEYNKSISLGFKPIE